MGVLGGMPDIRENEQLGPRYTPVIGYVGEWMHFATYEMKPNGEKYRDSPAATNLAVQLQRWYRGRKLTERCVYEFAAYKRWKRDCGATETLTEQSIDNKQQERCNKERLHSKNKLVYMHKGIIGIQALWRGYPHRTTQPNRPGLLRRAS